MPDQLSVNQLTIGITVPQLAEGMPVGTIGAQLTVGHAMAIK